MTARYKPPVCNARIKVPIMSKQPMTVAEAGRKGGRERAKKLTKERLIEIAKQGYNASPLSVKHKQCQVDQNGDNKEK